MFLGKYSRASGWQTVVDVYGVVEERQRGMRLREVAAGTAISPTDRKKLLVGKNSDAEQIVEGTYNMFSGLMDELKLY